MTIAELVATFPGKPRAAFNLFTGPSTWELGEQSLDLVKSINGCRPTFTKLPVSGGLVMFQVDVTEGEAILLGKVFIDRDGVNWLRDVRISLRRSDPQVPPAATPFDH